MTGGLDLSAEGRVGSGRGMTNLCGSSTSSCGHAIEAYVPRGVTRDEHDHKSKRIMDRTSSTEERNDIHGENRKATGRK